MTKLTIKPKTRKVDGRRVLILKKVNDVRLNLENIELDAKPAVTRDQEILVEPEFLDYQGRFKTMADFKEFMQPSGAKTGLKDALNTQRIIALGYLDVNDIENITSGKCHLVYV